MISIGGGRWGRQASQEISTRARLPTRVVSPRGGKGGSMRPYFALGSLLEKKIKFGRKRQSTEGERTHEGTHQTSSPTQHPDWKERYRKRESRNHRLKGLKRKRGEVDWLATDMTRLSRGAHQGKKKERTKQRRTGKGFAGARLRLLASTGCLEEIA